MAENGIKISYLHHRRSKSNSKTKNLENTESDSFFWNLRVFLLKKREKHQLISLKIQKYRNRFFDLYFQIASYCGEEIFYICFLPFCYWILNPVFVLHQACLVTFCIAFGNIIKNIFMIPRPSCPPVWTPKGSQYEDHGFPSTHTMTCVAVPIYTVLFYYWCPFCYPNLNITPSQLISFPIILSLSILWSLSISISRLYNGYHSLLDVLFGAILGSSFSISLFFAWRKWLDNWITTNDVYVPILTFIIGLLFLKLHPLPLDNPFNPILPESALIVGMFVGVIIGLWINSYTTIQLLFTPLYFNFWNHIPILFYIVRFLFGMIVIFFVRLLAKKFYSKILFFFFLKNHQNMENKELLYLTEILTKYFTYFTISLAVIILVPFLYNIVGLYHPQISIRYPIILESTL